MGPPSDDPSHMSERSYHGVQSRFLNVLYVSDVRHMTIFMLVYAGLFILLLLFILFLSFVRLFVCLLFKCYRPTRSTTDSDAMPTT